MCTIDYEYIHVYIIFERLIYLTPGPSGLYATLYTKILEEMQKERKRIPYESSNSRRHFRNCNRRTGVQVIDEDL